MENTQRNYKIKSIRKYNREIEKTERDITKNTVLVGLTALATLVAYSSLGIEGIDIAQKIGKALGISKSNIIYNLLPENKVSELERIKEKSSKGVVFIGDGINDAPALSSSDVGISMGKFGSDITIEASDVVLIDDNPLKILELLDIAEKNQKIVLQNIILILGIKLVTMILGVIGVSNLWFAIFADVGVSILGVLNSSRLLKKN